MLCRHCKKATDNLFVDAKAKNKKGEITHLYYTCNPCNTARAKK